MATVLRLFAIQDQVAAVFHAPFAAQTEGAAMRECVRWMRMDGHPYGQTPGDFYLWEVGDFDDQGGVVAGVVPRRVASLVDLKRAADQAQLG